MKIFIVIPTYNEKDNIKELILKIFGLSIPDLNILIVDDNSPDGTADLVQDLMKNQTRLFIIKRPRKLGLGSAYREGFNFALDRGAEVVFEMDADFSHQPKYIPSLIKGLEGADLVIGSRYITGGRVENWPWRRLFLSRLANWYVNFVLGLGIKDATSGFRVYKKEVLQGINFKKILSDGYSFQVEMVYLVKRAGFKILETPIVFPDRKLGQSKISRGEVASAIKNIIKLKTKKDKNGKKTV